jgi:hypothetical protein
VSQSDLIFLTHSCIVPVPRIINGKSVILHVKVELEHQPLWRVTLGMLPALTSSSGRVAAIAPPMHVNVPHSCPTAYIYMRQALPALEASVC